MLPYVIPRKLQIAVEIRKGVNEMAIAQRTAGQAAGARVRTVAVRVPGALVAKTVSALSKLIAGSGGGYRSYRREGFPSTRCTRSLAGRRDASPGRMKGRAPRG